MAVFMAIIGLASAAGEARAGSVSPGLRASLEQLPPGEMVTALFLLRRQIEVALLDQALTIEGAGRQERHRRVVTALRAEARTGQERFLRSVRDLVDGGEVATCTPYWIVNAVAVQGTAPAIEGLAAHADVLEAQAELAIVVDGVRDPSGESTTTAPFLETDFGPDTPSADADFDPSAPMAPSARVAVSPGESRGIGVPPGLRAINAPRVWYELGVNGAGALVGSLDTGVDGTHPALQDRWRGRFGHDWRECWHDVLATNTQSPVDRTGHGTHVTGTLAGRALDDTIGVAWGAQWIAANAIDQGPGHPFDVDIMDCLQWFADPDGDPETIDDVPDVVVNSWGINEFMGGSPPYTDCDSRWWAAIDHCEAAGVALIWAAGGDGPAPGSVRSPADRATAAYNSFSVGTVDASNFEFPYPVASFSSRGPSGCAADETLRIKPEVCGPGVEVYSSVPGGRYEIWSGSAMAAPHVAGVVALLRAVDPDLPVDAIKRILMETARDEGPSGEDNAYGWGVIDAYAAVLSLGTTTTPPPRTPSAGLLLRSWPNPFSRATTIWFALEAPGPATLSMHDAGGRLVRTILQGPLLPGLRSAHWDGLDGAGRRMPPGMYFCRLKTGTAEAHARLVVLR